MTGPVRRTLDRLAGRLECRTGHHDYGPRRERQLPDDDVPNVRGVLNVWPCTRPGCDKIRAYAEHLTLLDGTPLDLTGMATEDTP